MEPHGYDEAIRMTGPTAGPVPPSLYARTARAAHPTSPFGGEHQTDVAVIGGGFTGLSAALHLAEAGLGVTLLDAQAPGWGASGRNGGQVNPGLKYDPDQVEERFGPDLGARMVALSYGAPDFVFNLVRRLGLDCEARQGGTLRLAYHPRNAAEVRATAEQCIRRGMPVEWLEGAALRSATGTDRYLGAMLDRRGGDVNPLGYARGLAEAASRAGARLHGESPALRLRREGGRWSITTPGGVLRAPRVVIATNGYTDGLWPGLRRSIVPVHSAIAATGPLPAAVLRDVLPLRSAAYESGRITVYYRVDAQNRLLMGGRGPQRDIAGIGPIGYLTDYAQRLWPALAGIPWEAGWNGRLAVTPDHYPHVHAPAEGISICLGYNGRGVAMASTMGAQLARWLSEQRPPDMPVTDIAPMRLHAFWRLGVAGAVWKGRLLDRLGR
jgi:glycine/D-amino acid oxidase-like deaminating enzyme